MALESTQPLTEMNTRDLRGGCVGLITLPPSCADCQKSWKPQSSGTLRALLVLYRESFTFISCVLRVSFSNQGGYYSRSDIYADYTNEVRSHFWFGDLKEGLLEDRKGNRTLTFRWAFGNHAVKVGCG